MKRIKFSLEEKGCDVTGIIAGKDETWEKLIPPHMRHYIDDLFELLQGSLKLCHGFLLGTWPEYVIVIFQESDLFSLLFHECSHLMRHIIWDLGDSIHQSSDESYGKLESLIFDTFVSKLKSDYGLKVVYQFAPNAAQKKREIK